MRSEVWNKWSQQSEEPKREAKNDDWQWRNVTQERSNVVKADGSDKAIQSD